MPTNDSPNPYQVTFLEDEKPEKPMVGEIRFVRRKPVLCKLTGKMIRRFTWQTFRSKPWPFIRLGLLQLVMLPIAILLAYLVVLPFASIAIIASNSDNPPVAVEFCITLLFMIVLSFFELIGYAVVSDGAIRLLRGKKFFRKNPKSTLRLFLTWWNCFCYGLICLLMLLPVWVLIGASLIGLEQTGDMFLSNLWLAVFCVGLMLFALLGMYVLGRYAVGLHYIVDREVGCLTALRRSANYTRGNGFAIAMSFCLHCILLNGAAVLTFLGAANFLGLGTIELRPPYMEILFFIFIATPIVFGLLPIVAYLHCWLAVTYHLTTEQYEIPNATETQEW